MEEERKTEEEGAVLHGWKQIAAACECSVTTAKKYAKQDDLPVGKVGGRYRAYEGEVKKWRRLREQATVFPKSTRASSAQKSLPPYIRRRAVLALLVALTALIWAVVRLGKAPSPSPITIANFAPVRPEGVVALNRKGDIVWNRADIHPQAIALAQFDKVGQKVIVAGPMINEERLEDTRRLLLLDHATGEESGYLELVRGDRFFEGFSSRYGVAGIVPFDLDEDGVEELLVRYLHQPNYPAYTVLYEPRIKRSRVVFASTGHHHFRGAHDLDGRGGRELIFVGVNNSVSWYTAVAAVKLVPPVNQHPNQLGTTALSPNHDFRLNPWEALLWYALAAPGACNTEPCLEIDEEKQLLRFVGSRPFGLNFDGFDPESLSPLDPPDRQMSRRRAHDALRDASRLIRSGHCTDALTMTEVAVRALRETGAPWLLEWAQRKKADALISLGRVDEATAVVADSQARHPEIAGQLLFDGAVALHHSGEPEKAIDWYRRAFGLGATIDQSGRPSYEALRGMVFAYVELEELQKARDAIIELEDRLSSESWARYLPAFLRWVGGERAVLALPEHIVSAPDLERYWSLEMRLGEEGASEVFLKDIRAEWDRASFETRPLVLSLEAEVLMALDRRAEAAKVIGDTCRVVHGRLARSIISRAHWKLMSGRCCALRELFCSQSSVPAVSACR